MMLQILFSIWLILILFCSFVNTKISICLYLSYVLLVPFIEINIGGFSLGVNFINTILLIGFLLKNWRNKHLIDFHIFKPFLYLYLFYFIMIFFQTGVPIEEMLNRIRVSFMMVFILPFIIWNSYRMDSTIINALRKTLLVCIIIISVYGLCLTLIPGINPYLIAVLPLNGEEFNIEYAFSSDDGRIFGRISSVFPHPMMFGFFLCLSILYLWTIRNNINKIWLIISLVIIILDVLFCGVRSAIGGVAAGTIFYLIKKRNLKLIVNIAFIVIAVIFVISFVPELSDYVYSIVDFNNKRGMVKGSTFDMRIEQLYGSLHEIVNCPLVGKGFQWHDYYRVLHGDHPIILSFESMIYSVLCDNGFLGVIAWIIISFYFLARKKKNLETQLMVQVLYVIYLSYSCITGENGYFRYFLIMYVMVIINYLDLSMRKINVDKNI